jgi:Zn-dependent protease/predicted transcriptional regulator
MRWSLRIARVSGIDIKVHASFMLIVLYFAVAFGADHGPAGAVFGVVLVSCLFACVVLHELGHSLVAQTLGVNVREIVLLPIGGVARLGREPSRPVDELVIAIAGPLVNVVIAVALTALAWIVLGPHWVLGGALFSSVVGPPSAVSLLGWMITANGVLALFNMVPALPMDGGRVLRAILAMMLGKPRGTRIAAAVGQLLAAVMGVFAIYQHDLILALIAVFVFLGASQERMSSQVTQALVGLSAGEACDPNAVVLAPGDMIGQVIDHLLRAPQSHFAVVHGSEIVGTLSRDEAVAGAGSMGLAAFVAGVMRRDIAHVDENTPLQDVRARIIELGGRPVAVRGPQGFIGILGYEDVSRISALAAALKRRGVVRPAVRSSGGAPIV